MSRMHYEAIAAALRETSIDVELLGLSPEQVVDMAAERIAAVFTADNPRFDRARFMSACFDDKKASRK